MKIRLANPNDINQIMEIINDAKKYLKSQSLKQWNLDDGYPQKEVLLNDINNKSCYVLEKDNILISTMSVVFTVDENYNEIYNGNWLTNDKYASIHRIAIRNEYHHLKLGIYMLLEAENIVKDKNIYSIKIDTHKLNIPMTKTILNAGYTHCGTIILKRTAEDNLREAFEKRLD
jgi:hypothetical protein